MKLLVTDYDNTYELHYDNMDLDKIFYENQKNFRNFSAKQYCCISYSSFTT